jgi:hypothetical protein
MTNLSEVLDNVPDCREYLGFDELNVNVDRLAKDHPDVAKVLVLGNSAGGDPIRCLKIGEGKHHALAYGFPNPEEPVGGVLLDYFTHQLAENKSLLRELDYTWYMITCVDPDGARLNNGFLKGPLTPINFARNYYRSPTTLTGEENFPFRHGEIDFNSPLPETKALMKLLDQVRFDLIVSLHNMKWGGITYQVSESCPELYPTLQNLTKTFRLEPRKRLGTMLAPAVQLAEYFTPVKNYVRAKSAGKGPLQTLTGAFVYEYALLSNPKVFMIVPECCLWHDLRCWDDTPSKTSMVDVLRYSSQVGSETNKFILSLFDKAEPHLKESSPFLTMMRPIVQEIRRPTVNVLDPDPELGEEKLKRPATVSEKCETEGRADVYRLFNLGAMIRMFDYQLSKGQGNRSILEACRTDASNKLDEWNRLLEMQYRCEHHPIRNLIGACLGSVLASAEYVKWRLWEI